MYSQLTCGTVFACLIVCKVVIVAAETTDSTLTGTLSHIKESDSNDSKTVGAPKTPHKYIIEPIDNTADLIESATFIYDDVSFEDNKVTEKDEEVKLKEETTQEESYSKLTTEAILIKDKVTNFETEITTNEYTDSYDYATQKIGESSAENYTENELKETTLTPTVDSNESIEFHNEELTIFESRDEIPPQNRQYVGNPPPNRRKKPSRGGPNRPSKNSTFSHGHSRPTRKPLRTTTTTPQPVPWYSNFLPPLPQLPTLPPFTLPTITPTLFGPYSYPAVANQTQPLFGLSYLFIPQNNTVPFVRPWSFSPFPQNNNVNGNLARHGLFFRPFTNQSYFFHPFYKHLNKSAVLNTTQNNFAYKKHNHWNLTKSSLNQTNTNGQVVQIVLPYKKSKIQQVVTDDDTVEVEELVETEQIIEYIDDEDEVIEVIRRRRPKPKTKIRPQRIRIPQVVEVRRSAHPSDISNKVEPFIQLTDYDTPWLSERSNGKLESSESEIPKSIPNEPESSSLLFEVQVPNPVYKFFNKFLQIFSR